MSDRLAILIGNGRFEHEASPPELFGPRHDVASLGKLLSDPDIGNYIVFELLDRESGALLEELEPLFAMGEEQESVLLYFAGYIFSEPGRGLFLATADTELDRVHETAVPLSAIKSMLRSCGGDVAVIFDCCFSGPAGVVDISDIEHELRRVRTDVDNDLHLLSSPATTQSPASRETPTDSGLEGMLTRYIVEGISTGAADRDGDNRTTVSELNEYLGMRMGEVRPLWAGPLEGSDPEIVANPNPIEGVDLEGLDVMEEASRSVRTALKGVAAAALAVAVLGAGVYFWPEGSEPEPIQLDEMYVGEALPESVGRFGDLGSLRTVIDRTGWVEHLEPLDGAGPRYPDAVTFRLTDLNAERPGVVDLGLTHWALMDFGSGIFGFGVECAEGLNIAEIVVRLADGQEYTFEVRTEQAGNEFFGFVSRTPILRVRIESTSTRFAARSLYMYAEHEFPRAGAGGS